MPRSISRALLLPVVLFVVGLVHVATPPSGADPATAAAAPEIAVKKAEGLTLDGRGLEEGWAAATTIAAESVDQAKPVVKVALCAGKLWILAEMPEDVGFSIGLKFMACPEGTAAAADSVQASYGPMEHRGPRFLMRGPKGAGRAIYRGEGATDLTRLGAWSIEASIPVEDLALPTDTTPVRLAVVVLSRQLNRFAGAPAGSAFQAPSTFAKLLPPEGGWSSTGKAVVDAAALASADQADDARQAAWREFLSAFHSGNVQLQDVRPKLIAPIDRALAARPDLAMIHVVKGNLLAQIDDAAGARSAYEKALKIAPHLPEAVWAVAAFDIAAYSTGPDTMPSDYPAAFARIAEEAKRRGGEPVALRAAEGSLRYSFGDFGRAVELLEPVVTRYPVDDELAGKATFAKKYAELWAQELGMRKADEAKSLPRVKITTSKGPILLELFEDDAPNTVRNFVWLAKAGYYDGLRFHRVIPFFMSQGGDPYSATAGDTRVGSGGPGYAIKTEPSRRRPFRGVVAMANSGPNTEGSQFFVTTGTSAHLDGQYSVFGRVLEGQEAVDRLVAGETILKAEVVRAREGEYRPVTVGGTPAPAPRR